MGTKTNICFIAATIWCVLSVGWFFLVMVDGDASGFVGMVIWLIVSGIVAWLFRRERKKGALELKGQFRRREGVLHFNFGLHKGKSIGRVQAEDHDYLEHLSNTHPDPDVRYLMRGSLVPANQRWQTDEARQGQGE